MLQRVIKSINWHQRQNVIFYGNLCHNLGPNPGLLRPTNVSRFPQKELICSLHTGDWCQNKPFVTNAPLQPPGVRNTLRIANLSTVIIRIAYLNYIMIFYLCAGEVCMLAQLSMVSRVDIYLNQ